MLYIFRIFMRRLISPEKGKKINITKSESNLYADEKK